MPYRVGLKDERPTSNFQLPTSNKKQKYKTEHSTTPSSGFFAAVLIRVTKILNISYVSCKIPSYGTR
jgi:hypothetical protein